MTSKAQNEDSQWEDRQNRSNNVFEQFIREARRKGEMTVVFVSKLRESFRIRQEAEEKRFREEEKKKQLLLDETLAKKIQEEEEKQLLREMKKKEREKSHRQQEKEKQMTDKWEKYNKNCLKI